MELIIKEQKAIFLDICWIADTARAKKAQKICRRREAHGTGENYE